MKACGSSSKDYTSLMATIVNLEENIGKTVGRRHEDEDPFVLYSKLLKVSGDLVSKTAHPRGVVKFKTHEEADAWRWNNILKAARKH
jgi:hypothetical protein